MCLVQCHTVSPYVQEGVSGAKTGSNRCFRLTKTKCLVNAKTRTITVLLIGQFKNNKKWAAYDYTPEKMSFQIVGKRSFFVACAEIFVCIAICKHNSFV